MFHYYPVAEEIQERQKCLPFTRYVKVLYDDPAPVLRISKPQPIFISERYKEFAERVKEFPIRNSDVWICSYPKTGTTLTLEMVRVLRNGTDNNEEDIFTSVPFLELHALTETLPIDMLNLAALTETLPIDMLNLAASVPDPRVIKTHLQINLLPKDLLTSNAKIIYVVRNPKDTAISYYHHHLNMHCWRNDDLNVFLEDFLTGNIIFGWYFSHAEEYLRLAKLMDNVLVVKYEDMVTDMKRVVSTVGKFLELSLSDDHAVIADYLHFDQMKMRSTSNMERATEHIKQVRGEDTGFKFMRKGKVGSSKDEMPSEFHEKFDKETRKWKNLSELYPN